MAWVEGEIEGVTTQPLSSCDDARGSLIELFRSDDPALGACPPTMGYISVTRPGVSRGPHEHRSQTDTFCFVGPGRFKLRLWDSRPESPTRGTVMTCIVGVGSPMRVVIPPGVVHAYCNVSEEDATVYNFPDRLYAGPGKTEPVDEIRHENDPNSPYTMD